MDDALVSIIVPVYNIEEYLDDCITSIVNQSYQSIEIILVDDGSTDSSGNICDIWKSKDNRISVLHKYNEGLSAARNTGISLSKGKYLAFVDGDDVIHPDFVLDLCSVLKKYNSKISVCNVKYCYNDEDYVFLDKSPINTEVLSGNKLWDRFLEGDRIADLNISCNKLYDRELFDSIRFPVGRFHEDDATTYKLLYNCQRIAIVHKNLYFYRQRTGSIVYSAITLRRCIDIIDSVKGRVEFFSNYIPNYAIKISYFELYRYIDMLTKIKGIEKMLIKKSALELYKEIKSSLPMVERLKIQMFIILPCGFSLYLASHKSIN